MHREDPAENEDELGTRLLGIVHALAVELAPERAGARLRLDSDLDRDLGFDSLSRVELLLRIEGELGVHLSERAYAGAETPGDLLDAVRAARAVGATRAGSGRPAPVLPARSPGAAEALPDRVETLQGVLEWRARHDGARTHVLAYETDAEEPVAISFADLERGAGELAAGLVAEGLEPRQSVAIMLPTSRDYLESFFAVLKAGGIPVPIYPPARPSQLEDHLKRHAKILDNAGAKLLITVPEGRALARLLGRQVAGLSAVRTPEELRGRGGSCPEVVTSADDVAFLQYTSGSTGQPKGVILSHANLLANIRAMGEWVRATPEDVFVSWLPLYHDMGLIGAWLGSLYYAMQSVLMPPTAFLTRPWCWFEAVHRHGATITAAPNFAWELCLAKIPEEKFSGLDLSSLRLAFNGAEPVSPQTVRRFVERFAAYGFEPTAFCPVYGLAEAAVGLTFPPLGRGPLIDRVQRETFERTGRAALLEGDESAAEFVACGQPLKGYEVRIVDEADRELAERQTGRLQFRGPSATRGYMGNPEATAKLFSGDWLDTGDLAYVAGGDVYLTSRVKDVIIRAGRNIYPYELEEAVGDLPEVRKGCVAVFGSTDPDSEIEQLVVVAETRQSDPARQAELRRQIGVLASDLLGVAPDDVLLAPPRTVLKTSSGKIRRAGCRELYEQGRIGQAPRAAWWQMLRLWLQGLLPQWRQGLRRLGDLAYVAWCYLAFAGLLPAAVLVLLLGPSREARWRGLGRVARALLAVCRVPLLSRGAEHVPRESSCVMVANHASYLDGLLMVAVLPRPVTFVAKGELRDQWFPRWFLGRIGAEFVERFDVEQGTADAERLRRLAMGAAPLLFFPEGTFTRYPGLLGFRMGAFLAAAGNGLPVLPITIRGSRSVLRSDDWFPRRGPLAVTVGKPVTAAGAGWEAALELRSRARSEILANVGEQDLALERGLP